MICCGQIHAENGKAEACEIDLVEPSNIPKLFDWAETVFGPVDILVNNAAHYEKSDTIFTTSPDTLKSTFDVNTRAAVLLIAEFVGAARTGRLDGGASST